MGDRLKKWQTWDFRLWQLVAIVLLIIAVRLVLCSAQQIYLDPDESLFDDTLMYSQAVSITEGEWLGPYNFLTLSKHSFFSLWLAMLHVLGIPYLLGGQLLWTVACLFACWAFAPLLRRRWVALVFFIFLLFNPAATANPAPFGYITRVYRDNIFPSLCLLCICGLVGFALRYKGPLKQSVGWLILCGLAFAACWLTREDGMWPLPFLLLGSLILFIFIIRSGLPGKAARCLCLLLPFAVLFCGIGAWCGMNYAYYGRFILSDFTSHEFADAYGALVRVRPDAWDPEYAVPENVRKELYALSPAFGELEEYLEHPKTKDRFGNHRSGGFYWALREAAANQGYYDTPQKAREYFTRLAAEVNALCDEGVVPAGPKRSSVTPPLDARYIPPVAKQWGQSLLFCATFENCDPHSLLSRPKYEGQFDPIEAFLHEKALTAMRENSLEPYYSRPQQLAFGALSAIRLVYRILLPVLLILALAWQVLQGMQLFGKQRKKEAESGGELLPWILLLGILLLALLRAAMIAFTQVSSFTIGVYVMYLASVHPLLLLYGFTGSFLLLRQFWLKRPGPMVA